MPFYVPVGPRGIILRFGMILTRVLGSWVYRRACSRRLRGRLPLDPAEA
jgi:hypothetical protein